MRATAANEASPGRLRIAAWAVASLFFFYAFLQRVSPAAMVDELMRDFAVGGAVLGQMSAFYFYSYAALQIPIGVLMDRFGPRRMMTSAAVLCAAGSALFAWSDAIAPAFAGRLMIGAGSALSWVGVLAVIALWFPPRRFASLAGLAQAGGMAGAVFGLAPVAASVASVGWRSTVMILGAAALLLAAALWLTVRDRPRQGGSELRLLEGLRLVAANRQTWLCALFGFAVTVPLLGFAGLWGVPYLTAAYGIGRTEAAGVVTLMYVGWGISAPFVGGISDRVGRRPVMIAGSSLTALTIAAALYLPVGLLGISVLLFLSGVFASCMPLSFAAAREHNPEGATGAAFGIVNTCVMLGGAVIQPVIGGVLDLSWDGLMQEGVRIYAPSDYAAALAVVPAGAALAVLAAWLLREPKPVIPRGAE